MKKMLISLLVMLFIGHSAFSKIWRVNNTGVPADFTTAQAAHDGALAGDTLHFESSNATYGSLTMTKRLVIIGNGYFLGTLSANSNPDLQANTAVSIISNMVINPGSDNSVIMGMTLNGTTNIGLTGMVSNLLIRRNNINTINITFGNSIQIVANYISANTNTAINSNGGTNLQIDNNIFLGGVTTGAAANGEFKNNVVGANLGGPNITFTGFTVWNNIMVTGGVSFTTCDIRNNIGNSTQFGTTNGNQQNVVMTTVLEDPNNTNAAFSEDSRFQLKAGSPAIGAANPSGDCGIFGTATGVAYVLSGMPNVPSIYKLVAPNTVTGNTLNITVSTKIN
jgi:hypothetical protein